MRDPTEEDLLLIEAQREVDAITPSVPPIAPTTPLRLKKTPPPPLEGYERGALASPGMLPRPPGTTFNQTTQQFELKDGKVVDLLVVERVGWLKILKGFYDDPTIRSFYL